MKHAKNITLALAAFLTATLAGIGAEQGKPVSVSETVRALVSERCMDCHDDATSKGDFSLESLGDSVTDVTAIWWLRALEQIERGTMPPPKKKQPAADERQAVVLALESTLASFSESKPVRETAVLRRLNRTEYRRTLEDLLHLDLSRRDPTTEFPDDNRSHGFASDGGKLVTSSYLMRHYLTAAKDVVGRAVHFEPQPETRTWSLSAPFEKTAGGHRHSEREWYAKTLREPQPYQTLEYRRGALPLEDLREGVAMSGWYSFRILAEAKFRYADMDPKKMFGSGSLVDPSQPLRLEMTLSTLVGVDPANKDAVRDALIGSFGEETTLGDRSIAIWDVPDDVPTWLECRVWLEAGQFPRFAFPNGPTDSNNRITGFVKENKYTLLDKKQLAAYEQANLSGDWGHLIFFETPRIRIHKVEVKGPLNEQWPPASHRAIFGDTPYASAKADEVLRAFAERAWRRPVAAADVEPILKLVRSAEKTATDAGAPPEQAAQSAITQGVRAVLCAPEFLYREERAAQLDGREIASRLSYFLWSSLPDDKLMARAAAGDLIKPEVRRNEAERMLADGRADTFVREFLDGWLGMRKLGSMKPQGGGFNVYYDDHLEPAMRTESRLFFKRLLQTNGPIADFLDSDYTFVNRALAKHYGIDWQAAEPSLGKPVEGLTRDDLQPDGAGDSPSQGFVQVKLIDKRRGGLLGQASVLTLTANGVDTSPIIRGIWLLENILGAPPSPPPPNVPVIEPDIRGATTLRQRLEKHRENAACAGCHRQIDPPGFALESFDAIGRWRGHYNPVNNTALPVDPSGDFNGHEFRDVIGFKEALLQRQPQFARSLVEKLLIHALGRELTAADRPAIRRIVEQAATNGYRLRDLVLLCCESDRITRK
jgi:hypothetical protein|uniref:DUF1592 domain-containing protein n=1 Tax=Prosthecobacter sp. TaxID=1965333 RepID=UPI003782DD82